MAAIWGVAKKAIKEALIHVYTPVGDEILHPKERQRLPYPIRPRRQIKMDTPAPPTNTATMPRISDELRDLVYNWRFTTRDGVAYFLPPVTIEGSLTIIMVILQGTIVYKCYTGHVIQAKEETAKPEGGYHDIGN